MMAVLAGSPLVIFVLHAGLSRLAGSGSRQLLAVRVAAAGALPTGFMLWYLVFRPMGGGGAGTAVLYSSIVYICLATTYFHFFNMSETARRIRILYEVHRAGSLGARELEALYKTTDIISIRLKRMAAMGQLRREGDFYVIGRQTLLRAAQAIMFWRKLLGLTSVGKGVEEL